MSALHTAVLGCLVIPLFFPLTTPHPVVPQPQLHTHSLVDFFHLVSVTKFCGVPRC